MQKMVCSNCGAPLNVKKHRTGNDYFVCNHCDSTFHPNQNSNSVMMSDGSIDIDITIETQTSEPRKVFSNPGKVDKKIIGGTGYFSTYYGVSLILKIIFFTLPFCIVQGFLDEKAKDDPGYIVFLSIIFVVLLVLFLRKMNVVIDKHRLTLTHSPFPIGNRTLFLKDVDRFFTIQEKKRTTLCYREKSGVQFHLIKKIYEPKAIYLADEFNKFLE